MTEDEAKRKWCPHAVASHTDPRRGFHEVESVEPTHPCIASKCMAWRWGGPAKWDKTDGRTPEEAGAKTIRHGYCGLSGVPS